MSDVIFLSGVLHVHVCIFNVTPLCFHFSAGDSSGVLARVLIYFLISPTYIMGVDRSHFPLTYIQHTPAVSATPQLISLVACSMFSEKFNQ